MRTQKFGIEIEMTGITREEAAAVIAGHFRTESYYIGTYYKTYGAKDRKGPGMESNLRLQHHRTEESAGKNPGGG